MLGVANTHLPHRAHIDAERALAIGPARAAVADDEEVETAALELAAEIAGNAPLSMKGNKRAIETLARFPRLTPAQERELIELRASRAFARRTSARDRRVRREAATSLAGQVTGDGRDHADGGARGRRSGDGRADRPDRPDVDREAPPRPAAVIYGSSYARSSASSSPQGGGDDLRAGAGAL